jgi:hypothetical protein
MRGGAINEAKLISVSVENPNYMRDGCEVSEISERLSRERRQRRRLVALKCGRCGGRLIGGGSSVRELYILGA